MNSYITDKKISGVRTLALRFVSVLFLMMVFIFALSPSSHAAQSVDNSRLCSLTLDYHSGGTALSGVAFRIYRVADVSETMVFTLSGDFKNYGVNVNNLTASGWRSAADSLASHIAPDGIPTLRTQSTNGSGIVSFSSLATGLYLVIGDSTSIGNTTYYTSPFLISLPNSYDGNTLVYDLTSIPKVAYDEPHHDDNTFVDISVIKVWDDDGNESKRPESINVTLFRENKPFDTYVLNAKNGWQHTWNNLETGYMWSVIENNVPDGYTVTYTNEGTRLYIKNSYDGGKKYVNVNVLKVWDDEGYPEKRPTSIDVSLMRDGIVYETFNLNESNSWQHSWSGLPNSYIWTVEERNVPNGYVASYSTEGNRTTITNSYRKNIDISVLKVWDDVGNENKRPTSIGVFLLKDGNVYDIYTLSADNNWKHTWTNLSGSAVWTVKEDKVPDGYTATYTANNTQRVITNTYTNNKQGIGVTVIKQWNDSGYEYKRPASIEISLLKDGNVYDTYILSNDNGWSHTWTGLSGDSVWTVIENNVSDDYEATYSVGGTTLYITNKYMPRLPNTGMLWWPVPLLAAAGLLLFTIGLRRRLRGRKNEE